ncbi:hypothetical protein [Paenibacillus validus]|uniref:hypothetical protein n=1 Tax=Paenibacillus validus TaxID=44253 RepID=UPI003D2ACC7A
MLQIERQDRMRLIYEKDASGQTKADSYQPLAEGALPICRKDFLCNCMSKFKETISSQALEKAGTPQ